MDIIRQAIQTRIYEPTKNKGKRIKARIDNRLIWVDWNKSINNSLNHISAAQKLMAHLNWSNEFVTGCIGNVYYHVLGKEKK